MFIKSKGPICFFSSIPLTAITCLVLLLFPSMANMDSQGPKHSTITPPPTLTTPPTPLKLSGFLSGDTIQVQGDTGNLQFSVQLNVNKKLFPEKISPLHSLETVEYTPQKFSFEDSSDSSFVTPIASEQLRDENCWRFEEEGETVSQSCVVTRLRSGAISPVSYFPRISLSCCEKVAKSRKKKYRSREKKKMDVFERLFRRHSFPIRPCTSYAFFVMATWGNVKSSSFGETSKRLGQIWCKIPQKEKKFYEEMADKDNARYKKQSKLFRSKGD